MSRETWAITGASGYVGRALTSRALGCGKRLRLLCRSPRPAEPSVEIVTGALEQSDVLVRLVRGADVVVHLAARVHRWGESARERADSWRVNVDGTSALVDAISSTPSPPFMVFVSTAGVYPLSNVPLDETSAPAPRSFYGSTKHEAERRVFTAIDAGRLTGAVLRPAMVFGPGAPGSLRLLMAMVRRGIVFEYDGGRQAKSLVTIDGLVDAIMAVAGSARERNGEVYNVVGSVLTLREITGIAAEALGVRPWRVPLPLRVSLACAAGADAAAHAIGLRGVDIVRLVTAYSSSAVISDARLRALGIGETRDAVERALRRTAVAIRRG